ncbi:MAG: stage 0 sporulation protein, partial [Clostridiales bacterium]|nr:stage 0 sporulation protein [Clostridiales bacterium]
MTVIGVRFKNSNKVYYFNPLDIEFEEGDGVIVETARGLEYGRCAAPNKNVPDKEVVQPLKDVLRKATHEDDEQSDKNNRMRAEALPKVNEIVRRHRLEMKVV